MDIAEDDEVVGMVVLPKNDEAEHSLLVLSEQGYIFGIFIYKKAYNVATNKTCATCNQYIFHNVFALVLLNYYCCWRARRCKQ